MIYPTLPLSHSVDIVPVVESHPRASIPTVITNGQQTSPPSSRRKGSETESTVSHLHSSQERLLDSSLESTLSISHGFGSNTESQEDLLEDDRRPRKRNNRDRVGLGKHHRGDDALKLERTVNILNSYDGFRKESIMEEELGSHKERVERVHSLVGPRSFATPEKLILHSEDGVGSADDEWMLSRYPRGSHTITIQRGDKGFGIMMVEGKVREAESWVEGISVCMVKLLLEVRENLARTLGSIVHVARVLELDCTVVQQNCTTKI